MASLVILLQIFSFYCVFSACQGVTEVSGFQPAGVMAKSACLCRGAPKCGQAACTFIIDDNILHELHMSRLGAPKSQRDAVPSIYHKTLAKKSKSKKEMLPQEEALKNVTGKVWSTASDVEGVHCLRNACVQARKSGISCKELIREIDKGTRLLAKKLPRRVWFVDMSMEDVSRELRSVLQVDDAWHELWARHILLDTLRVQDQSALKLWNSSKGFVFLREHSAIPYKDAPSPESFSKFISAGLVLKKKDMIKYHKHLAMLTHSWRSWQAMVEAHIGKSFGGVDPVCRIDVGGCVSALEQVSILASSKVVFHDPLDFSIRRDMTLEALWEKTPRYVRNFIDVACTSRFVFLFNTLFTSVKCPQIPAYEVFIKTLLDVAQCVYQGSKNQCDVSQFLLMVFYATREFFAFPAIGGDGSRPFQQMFSLWRTDLTQSAFVREVCALYCWGYKDVCEILISWRDKFLPRIEDALGQKIQRRDIDSETKRAVRVFFPDDPDVEATTLPAVTQLLHSARNYIPEASAAGLKEGAEVLNGSRDYSEKVLEVLCDPVKKVFVCLVSVPEIVILPDTPHGRALMTLPTPEVLKSGNETLVRKVHLALKFLLARRLACVGEDQLIEADVDHFWTLPYQVFRAFWDTY